MELLSDFLAWAWARHHNVLSWYIRPFSGDFTVRVSRRLGGGETSISAGPFARVPRFEQPAPGTPTVVEGTESGAPAEATKAINEMNGKRVDGRPLRVNEAEERAPRPGQRGPKKLELVEQGLHRRAPGVEGLVVRGARAGPAGGPEATAGATMAGFQARGDE